MGTDNGPPHASATETLRVEGLLREIRDLLRDRLPGRGEEGEYDPEFRCGPTDDHVERVWRASATPEQMRATLTTRLRMISDRDAEIARLREEVERLADELKIEREHNPSRCICAKCGASMPCESCAQYQEDVERLREEVERLTRERDEQKARGDELEDELRDALRERDEAREEAAQEAHYRAEAEDALLPDSPVFDETEHERYGKDWWRTRCLRIANAKLKVIAERDRLREEVEKWKSRSAQLSHSRGDAKAEVARLGLEEERDKKALADMTAEIEQLRAEVERLTRERDRLRAALVMARKKVRAPARCGACDDVAETIDAALAPPAPDGEEAR